MKGRTVALDHLNGRAAAALIVDGVLDDFLIDPAPGEPVPGSIYQAICDRAIKGQGGVIMRLPEGPGFLRHDKNLRPGQRILAQVTGFAEPGKAIPVTQKIVFKSRYVIVTPDAPGINVSRRIRNEVEVIRLLEALDADAITKIGFGIIVRSQAEGIDQIEISQDADVTLATANAVMSETGNDIKLLASGSNAHQLGWREWAAPQQVFKEDGSFEDLGVLEMITQLHDPQVMLGRGASIYIEPTRALVAVDVNTGSDTSPAAGIKSNLACAKELPRQLRLRGLGGQITIDLAPMPKKDRHQFENALRSALKADPIETALVGWTPLGHFELQRKRERLPIAESLPI